jgi:hypothetical protein
MPFLNPDEIAWDSGQRPLSLLLTLLLGTSFRENYTIPRDFRYSMLILADSNGGRIH